MTSCYTPELYWVRMNVRSVWVRDFVTHVIEIDDIYRYILEDEISRRLSIRLECELWILSAFTLKVKMEENGMHFHHL